MNDELTRRIDEYAVAEAAYTMAREDKLAFMSDDHRSPYAATDTRMKLVVAELNRAKDALCLYVLGHRDELARASQMEAAIKTVLADEESGAGGWGPDVTMVALLREAVGE